MQKMGRRKRSRLMTLGLLAPDGAERKASLEGDSKAAAAPKATKAAAAPATKAGSAPASKAAAPKAAAVKEPKSAEPKAPAGELDIKGLSERVKARRKEKGWTQADVARTSGLSANAVSQIERCLNESPAEDVLAKLDTGLEWPRNTSDSILRGTAELVSAG